MKNKVIFFTIFAVLGLLALQVPINYLTGAKVKFTLFDLFAPVSAGFLGTPLGVAAVATMQLVNLAFHGFTNIDSSNILKLVATLRIVPMAFGVWYFAHAASKTSSKKLLIVPLLAIVAFNLHPFGRGAWVYSMFWLIPLLVWPFRSKSIIARSLGSTFTAHSVGGAMWIWAFNLPSAVWLGMIPVVALERSIFALGMSASYILFNNVFTFLNAKKILPSGLNLSKKHLIKKSS